MKFWKYGLIFAVGGLGYVGLELLYRGRSHISMFFAGGLCLLLIGHLEEVGPKLPLALRWLAGSGIITMVELGTGLLVNRTYSVWDYRNQPGNFLGQICPVFCLLWIPAAAAAGWLYLRLKRLLTRHPRRNPPFEA